MINKLSLLYYTFFSNKYEIYYLNNLIILILSYHHIYDISMIYDIKIKVFKTFLQKLIYNFKI